MYHQKFSRNKDISMEFQYENDYLHNKFFFQVEILGRQGSQITHIPSFEPILSQGIQFQSLHRNNSTEETK